MMANLAETKTCELSLCNIISHLSITIYVSTNLMNLVVPHAQANDITSLFYPIYPAIDQIHPTSSKYAVLMSLICCFIIIIQPHDSQAFKLSLYISSSTIDLIEIYAPNH
jgi:hypothetical protein